MRHTELPGRLLGEARAVWRAVSQLQSSSGVDARTYGNVALNPDRVGNRKTTHRDLANLLSPGISAAFDHRALTEQGIDPRGED